MIRRRVEALFLALFAHLAVMGFALRASSVHDASRVQRGHATEQETGGDRRKKTKQTRRCCSYIFTGSCGGTGASWLAEDSAHLHLGALHTQHTLVVGQGARTHTVALSLT